MLCGRGKGVDIVSALKGFENCVEFNKNDLPGSN